MVSNSEPSVWKPRVTISGTSNPGISHQAFSSSSSVAEAAEITILTTGNAAKRTWQDYVGIGSYDGRDGYMHGVAQHAKMVWTNQFSSAHPIQLKLQNESSQ